MGLPCGFAGNALFRLCTHHRGGAAPRPRYRARGSQRGNAARTHRLASLPGAAFAVDCGGGTRGLPGLSGPRRLRPGGAQTRKPARPVALAGRRPVHDAGHDVRLARVLCPTRRPDARDGDPAALGFLGAVAAGGAVCLRAVLHECLARRARAPREHGPARGAGHADHLCREHARHLRALGPVWRRGVLRLADDVRVLPALGPAARDAAARPDSGRARGGDEPPARQRRAPGRQWLLGTRGHAPPAGRRHGARAGRGSFSRRWRDPRRQHPCRRGIVDR